MTSALKKHLSLAFAPAASAALLALLLLAPAAQAHSRASHADNCTCDAVPHHAAKKFAKKAAPPKTVAHPHRKYSVVRHLHRRHHSTISVKYARLVVTPHNLRAAPVAEYVRILPEQNCNMEPPFAVPACQARLKAAGQE